MPIFDQLIWAAREFSAASEQEIIEIAQKREQRAQSWLDRGSEQYIPITQGWASRGLVARCLSLGHAPELNFA